MWLVDESSRVDLVTIACRYPVVLTESCYLLADKRKRFEDFFDFGYEFLVFRERSLEDLKHYY